MCPRLTHPRSAAAPFVLTLKWRCFMSRPGSRRSPRVSSMRLCHPGVARHRWTRSEPRCCRASWSRPAARASCGTSEFSAAPPPSSPGPVVIGANAALSVRESGLAERSAEPQRKGRWCCSSVLGSTAVVDRAISAGQQGFVKDHLGAAGACGPERTAALPRMACTRPYSAEVRGYRNDLVIEAGRVDR